MLCHPHPVSAHACVPSPELHCSNIVKAIASVQITTPGCPGHIIQLHMHTVTDVGDNPECDHAKHGASRFHGHCCQQLHRRRSVADCCNQRVCLGVLHGVAAVSCCPFSCPGAYSYHCCFTAGQMLLLHHVALAVVNLSMPAATTESAVEYSIVQSAVNSAARCTFTELLHCKAPAASCLMSPTVRRQFVCYMTRSLLMACIVLGPAQKLTCPG